MRKIYTARIQFTEIAQRDVQIRNAISYWHAWHMAVDEAKSAYEYECKYAIWPGRLRSIELI